MPLKNKNMKKIVPLILVFLALIIQAYNSFNLGNGAFSVSLISSQNPFLISPVLLLILGLFFALEGKSKTMIGLASIILLGFFFNFYGMIAASPIGQSVSVEKVMSYFAESEKLLNYGILVSYFMILVAIFNEYKISKKENYSLMILTLLNIVLFVVSLFGLI